MPKEQADFTTTVSGIPCGVVVDSCLVVKGQGMRADSDIDCTGFAEIEWRLLDRKGYPTQWLQNKMTDSDKEKLEIEIIARNED